MILRLLLILVAVVCTTFKPIERTALKTVRTPYVKRITFRLCIGEEIPVPVKTYRELGLKPPQLVTYENGRYIYTDICE